MVLFKLAHTHFFMSPPIGFSPHPVTPVRDPCDKQSLNSPARKLVFPILTVPRTGGDLVSSTPDAATLINHQSQRAHHTESLGEAEPRPRQPAATLVPILSQAGSPAKVHLQFWANHCAAAKSWVRVLDCVLPPSYNKTLCT